MFVNRENVYLNSSYRLAKYPIIVRLKFRRVVIFLGKNLLWKELMAIPKGIVTRGWSIKPMAKIKFTNEFS